MTVLALLGLFDAAHAHAYGFTFSQSVCRRREEAWHGGRAAASPEQLTVDCCNLQDGQGGKPGAAADVGGFANNGGSSGACAVLAKVWEQPARRYDCTNAQGL